MSTGGVRSGNRVENVEIYETTEEPTALVPLSQTEHRPENPSLDIRGYLMFGSDGEAMGRVEDILLEADRRTESRGLPLYHLEYAVVRYTDNEGIGQWILVPMAVVKEISTEDRRVTVRGPARLACQQAISFRGPDDLSRRDEEVIYAFWEVEPRWQRSGRGPQEMAEKRR